MSKTPVVNREEKLLKYLLSLKRNDSNIVVFGKPRYNKVSGFTAEQVAQTLAALEDSGLVNLYFYGPKQAYTTCDITIKECGLTYFEDQKLDEEEKSLTAATT